MMNRTHVHLSRPMIFRLAVTLLTTLLAITGVSLTTMAPAAAAPFTVQGDRMQLSYVSNGNTRNIGWVDYRLNLNYVNGKPSVYGSIMAVQPYSGWNAVGYGSQTLVQCTNNLWSGSYYLSRCYVKVKMEKPGTVEASISGTWRGVTFNGGYNSGSGRSFMFFTGEVTVRRSSATGPYNVCYWYGNARCVNISAP